MIRLQKALTSTVVALSLALSPPHSDGASCHIVRCSMERSTWQGSEGGLHPTACEKLSPASHHVSKLESGSSLVEPWEPL